MAYQKPDLSGAVLRGFQGAKTLAELDKLRSEEEITKGLREAFAPIKSATPQTTEIGGMGVNIGTTARAPTGEEALTKARMVDPEKASLIEQYMAKSGNLVAETKKLELQAKETQQLSKFSSLVHAIDAYETTGGDVNTFKNVLKQYDPNDDTTGITPTGVRGQYVITSAKNPKGIPVNKQQLADAAIPLLDKFKESHADARFYTNIDRLLAKDAATLAAKQKAAKAATPGMVKQMAEYLDRELSGMEEYSGLSKEDFKAMSVDAEEYMNQLIKDRPDLTPTERRAAAMDLVMSNINKAQRSGFFGAISPGSFGSNFLDIGKPNVPAKYTKGQASAEASKQPATSKEPLPEGLTEERVERLLVLSKERNTGATRDSIIAKYKANLKKNK